MKTGSPQSPSAEEPSQIPRRGRLRAQLGNYSQWLILVALGAQAESGFWPNRWKPP